MAAVWLSGALRCRAGWLKLTTDFDFLRALHAPSEPIVYAAAGNITVEVYPRSNANRREWHYTAELCKCHVGTDVSEIVIDKLGFK